MRNKLIHFIDSTDIYILVPAPLLLSFFIIFAWVSLKERIDPTIFDRGTTIVAILSAGIMSLSGIFQICKREAPGVHIKYPYRGIWAIISGVIWISFCWGGIIYIIISTFVSKR